MSHLSSSLILLSNSNLYWKPAQPPPSTIILKLLPSAATSFNRFTQLSLILITSAAEYTLLWVRIRLKRYLSLLSLRIRQYDGVHTAVQRSKIKTDVYKLYLEVKSNLRHRNEC